MVLFVLNDCVELKFYKIIVYKVCDGPVFQMLNANSS